MKKFLPEKLRKVGSFILGVISGISDFIYILTTPFVLIFGLFAETTPTSANLKTFNDVDNSGSFVYLFLSFLAVASLVLFVQFWILLPIIDFYKNKVIDIKWVMIGKSFFLIPAVYFLSLFVGYISTAIIMGIKSFGDLFLSVIFFVFVLGCLKLIAETWQPSITGRK